MQAQYNSIIKQQSKHQNVNTKIGKKCKLCKSDMCISDMVTSISTKGKKSNTCNNCRIAEYNRKQNEQLDKLINEHNRYIELNTIIESSRDLRLLTKCTNS